MSTQFRVLGEVEAVVDGCRLDVGHARQRCVLAALLVDVNRPVTVDQLVDRVWADQPPSRARNALAGYLSRLRALLAGGEVTINRSPSGYTLSVDEKAVDLHLFRHLAASARAAGEPAEALEHFRQALDLWRGEPFAAMDSPWFADTRMSLAAERFSVLLDRNDAALRAGRHIEIVAELESLRHLHPLDERLAGQTMLAQSRSGRQADALATYRQVRQQLVDELGVDPGPILRAVHQQILDTDQSPPAAPKKPVPQPVPRPPSLPRRPTSFIGRTDQLAAVSEAVLSGPLITLTGVGGVGKTRLALEVADRTVGRFVHGASVCELAPVADGAMLGQTVAAGLGLQANPELGVEGTVIEHLRGHHLLLVIDNCEHVLDSAAGFVERVTANCPEVTVLATSREPLTVAGERIIPIPPLPHDEATELFAERARAGRPDFDLDAEPVGAVAEICRRLDGVPLAIELAAARTRMMNSLDIARRLDGLRLLSGNARGAHPRQQSVTATIDWSYRLLGDREQALFDRLSVFAGSFDFEAVHGVCADNDVTEDDTLEALTGLVDKSMVTIRGGATSTRYAVLETLRAYGRERLQHNGSHARYAMRHAHYFADLVERGAEAMHGPDEQAWIERLAPTAGTTVTSPDTENIRTAFEWAMANADTDTVMRMVASVCELMQMRVGYTATDWVDRAVAVADPGHPLFAEVIGVAARKAWVLGDFAEARALATRAGGRVPAPGHTYLGYPADVLAETSLSEGDPETALARYRAEVDVARGIDDAPRLVWVLYQITIALDFLGTPETGLSDAQEALRVARGTANPSTLAMACCAMGRALKRVDHERALVWFDEAIGHAAPVQNNWLTGIARMEAAATRALYADPSVAARELIDVLDHWAKAGPGTGSQHWFTMRFAAALLERLGADEDAAALRRAVAAAGHELLDESLLTTRPGQAPPLTGAQALALARSSLRRFC
ncbi:putative ATPase/DNA-binding SARP family transcriptional activator [Mycolicibacterium iranicum]|uniref:Putative ATPase/DNA-binding SARP family transcriptional activator n=1 Tax=Mycolicibacterium iranicum TaxID=912594 RepID=A0A839Q772_MYCIR|nr:BTAD domain-containing putative transcriptional regulator [Mycolicibacterium iranicum]MBB2990076.1 putative ATPase/DNA-binding SARP family transcriptional activator [Mycolicibacterium iranicum]